MKIIYNTKITTIGNKAGDFLQSYMFIIFKENVPRELADYCYIHNENNLVEDINPGDILYIDDVEYKITSIGDLVNQNLKQLGHITFKFTGDKEAAIPGTLFLERKKIVPLREGTVIKIIRN
ncbi:MAG: PTS glucitol/sorbitol transporter subunit IIA [Clostridium sp.]|jgi:PTS system glucitol/sorbitol-specific IIA component|uniref:PTS glucitol/sorbitol transporter subunit IIA n=1 Tax=Clostridium sp. TaxID=1506 RepID=UPI0025C32A9A|nr:PTS glucitol/sorbitol transporter subunit IIA [Clostridium sp.]MCH3964969.1 PTS glucitol/sorbitol transporter subunit IIA [Clostridium sp.]MCI1716537.1 PTS glucitol/sorbitol transporter subunit IIA [Clostridium sp.]MCI1800981.1 PTS glucitol/sorbitol transporter subunit IIA [Clostridium sp.]MCI1814714.1 PTS glucitol/sorbitol transporter subunit IIA [Clostridium sp.]MCI1871728.1 PTS glucitol/sorbitol transporter subunit IIA [Clostridium sp.]